MFFRRDTVSLDADMVLKRLLELALLWFPTLETELVSVSEWQI